jgi:hypothetical protein
MNQGIPSDQRIRCRGRFIGQTGTPVYFLHLHYRPNRNPTTYRGSSAYAGQQCQATLPFFEPCLMCVKKNHLELHCLRVYCTTIARDAPRMPDYCCSPALHASIVTTSACLGKTLDSRTRWTSSSPSTQPSDKTVSR